MTVSEDAWYNEVNGTLPRAICIAGEGCSAGTAAKRWDWSRSGRLVGGVPDGDVSYGREKAVAGTVRVPSRRRMMKFFMDGWILRQ